MYPKSFQKLIKNFSSLPSIGPKHAERLVLFLFKKSQEDIKDFSENLLDIKNLQFCKRCHNISEGDICQICANAKRDQKTVCVVEDPLDVISIERTHAYHGVYHVLGGVITATEKDDSLKIPDLFERIKKEGIAEIILATNPTTEGDMTSLYLKRKLHPLGVKITRLGRGLSTGADLEYADELTLSEALTNRKELL
ncbi:MAG: Recombination protein RecR [Parcubacteria group bacterium GW2011_GWC1_45_14]|nr:MAG: Recombination protein RecR [Candidatus Moranbacteria bacterium GW2011_GWC2_45_10]KKT94539.1 MAG: Recombination protein RecR [Parcubacteria group bacterium GW2011_GWC1_45_14]